jgi:hypothetical protein
MTYSNDQPGGQPRGYASVWRRDGGKVRASGQIRIKPEILRQWADTLEADPQYGNVTLDLVLFANDRATSDKSPQYTGYLQEPKPRDSQAQTYPTPPAQDDKPLDAYEDQPG